MEEWELRWKVGASGWLMAPVFGTARVEVHCRYWVEEAAMESHLLVASDVASEVVEP